MSLQYIRERYNVPAKQGMRIIHFGRIGVIKNSHGGYLSVYFYGDKKNERKHLHPTFKITYVPIDVNACELLRKMNTTEAVK